jgi:hypothetical protein
MRCGRAVERGSWETRRSGVDEKAVEAEEEDDGGGGGGGGRGWMKEMRG